MKNLNNKRLLALLFACQASFSSQVCSAATSYVGAGFLNLEEHNGDASVGVAHGRFGAFIDRYSSLEWRVGTGIKKETSRMPGEKIEMQVDVDLMYGVYLRGGVPLARYYPYVSIGYTRMDVNLVVWPVAAIEERLNDVSFGVGLDFSFTENIRGNVEYQQYINEAPIKINGASLGLSYLY